MRCLPAFPAFVLGAAFLLCSPLFADAAEVQSRQRLHSREMDIVQADVMEEVRFGREVAARVIGRYGLVSDPDLTKYVGLVGRVIAMNANRPELTFHFAILDTGEINAYASPGGYIFVTKGALAQMQDEAELAAVLAHEIAHVSERHVVKELNLKSAGGSTAGLARMIGGSTDAARTAFAQVVDKAVNILFKDGYKRDDEIQADKDAVIFSTLAGYDPTALARYFERLAAAKGKATEILDKTHPAYDARIAWIKETANAENIETGRLNTNRDRFAETMRTAEGTKQ